MSPQHNGNNTTAARELLARGGVGGEAIRDVTFNGRPVMTNGSHGNGEQQTQREFPACPLDGGRRFLDTSAEKPDVLYAICPRCSGELDEENKVHAVDRAFAEGIEEMLPDEFVARRIDLVKFAAQLQEAKEAHPNAEAENETLLASLRGLIEARIPRFVPDRLEYACRLRKEFRIVTKSPFSSSEAGIEEMRGLLKCDDPRKANKFQISGAIRSTWVQLDWYVANETGWGEVRRLQGRQEAAEEFVASHSELIASLTGSTEPTSAESTGAEADALATEPASAEEISATADTVLTPCPNYTGKTVRDLRILVRGRSDVTIPKLGRAPKGDILAALAKADRLVTKEVVAS